MDHTQSGKQSPVFQALVLEFIASLTEEQVTGVLRGSLYLAVIEDDTPIGIRQCGGCAGEGCKICDDTGVIYP